MKRLLVLSLFTVCAAFAQNGLPSAPAWSFTGGSANPIPPTTASVGKPCNDYANVGSIFVQTQNPTSSTSGYSGAWICVQTGSLPGGFTWLEITDSLGALLNTPAISNPAITGPAPVACGATCTVTSANGGGTILLNLAAGSIATLPAASGTGNVYKFIVSVTTTSAKDAILAASSSDAIIGLATGENSNTPLVFAGSAGTYHSLQMPFTGSQPSGGFKGDYFTCTDIAANLWACSGSYQAGTTPTTPYSTATS